MSSFVQAKSNTSTSGTSVGVTLDSTPTNGNVGGAFVLARGGSNLVITPPDGTWVSRARINNGTGVAVEFFTKAFGAGESATITFTFDDNNNSTTLHVVEISGIDTTTPYAGSGSATGFGTGGSANVTGLNAANLYALIIGSATTSNTSYTAPGSMDERTDTAITSGTTVTGATATQHGVTGSTSYARTHASAINGNYANLLVALNEASASGEQKSYSDSATGSESAGVTSALTAGESGSGQDRAAVTGPLSLTDSATGSDSASAAASASVGDTGVGQEQAGVAGSLTATDSGTGSESPAVAATLTVADSATGSESISVEISSGDEISVTFTDSATGQEVATITATLTAGDGATGDATLTIGVAVAPADAATGAEGATVAADVGPGDSASGDEGMTGEGALVMADSATGHDSISVVVTTPGEVAPTTMCVHLTIDGIEAVTLTITTTEGVTLALEGC